MYRWIVARLVRLGYRRLVAGHPEMLLGLAADDIHFEFPGTSSFAADTHDRASAERWVRRFISMDARFDVHDVIVTGAPWDTRIAVRFTDAIGDDYRNEGVEWLHLRWGTLRSVRVFLDTEVISAWEERHPDTAGALPV